LTRRIPRKPSTGLFTTIGHGGGHRFMPLLACGREGEASCTRVYVATPRAPGESDRMDMAVDRERAGEVSLRAVEDSDLDVLFDHEADRGAAEMAAFPARDRERFDAHWAKIRLDDTKVSRTVVVDGLVAGRVNSWQDDGRWLVGYWIGREYWGRGVATRALTLLLSEVPGRPVYAHVAAHNAGSIRVLQKCGFRRDRGQTHAPEPGDGVEELTFVLAG